MDSSRWPAPRERIIASQRQESGKPVKIVSVKAVVITPNVSPVFRVGDPVLEDLCRCLAVFPSFYYFIGIP